MRAYVCLNGLVRFSSLWSVSLLMLCGLTAGELPMLGSARAEPGTWHTYRNSHAGYSVDYPADWTVREQAGGDGSLITTFTSPGGGAGITVLVQPGAQSPGPSDLTHTRCQPVVIGRLSGMRCFDTIAFSTSTTLVGEGKSYTIVASTKHLEAHLYQRFLESFASLS